ncbi:hypothetical protein [Pseudogemmobacter bohemicus]|uniref:hypothetical protein n=1 Tax=Pseudogemmobacter bohemicus TaxID=2250708 RepID=UPI000DD42538|nr:hypothetical protein [Pseudogemmobacter bohemicus]
MQLNRTNDLAAARPQIRAQSADFDFGHSRAAGQSRKQRPGLAAGLVAFAFAVSMFLPVGARAEPAWQTYPDQLSEPARPGDGLGTILIESKRREPAGWDKSHRKPLPSACSMQIDGRRGGFSGYSENCLRNQGVRGKLPRDCATNARIFGQRDRVFSSQCLRDAGFVLRDY